MLHNQALPSDHGRHVTFGKFNERFLLPESPKDKKMSTELRSIPVESVEVN